MFCTRCGQTLPADGTPCPCGSGQRDLSAPQQPSYDNSGAYAPVNNQPYAQPTYTQPTYTQSVYGQPPYGQPPYGQQPNPYAPPAYAVQQPNTPFVAAIRQAAASPLFMVATVLMSLNLLFAAIQNFIPFNYAKLFYSMVPFLNAIDPSAGSAFMDELNMILPELYAAQASSGFAALPSLVSPILVVTALWIIFTSARSKTAPSAGGLTILQVLQIISLVGAGFGILIMIGLAAMLVILIAALMEEVNRYGVMPEETAGMIVTVAVVFMLVLIAVMVLELLFSIKTLTTILQVKKGIKEGVVTKPASAFVMVCCFLSGGYCILSSIVAFGYVNWASGMAVIFGGAAYILFGVCIGQYNKLVKPLLKGDTQQPAQQDYDPYNGGYPPVY